METLKVYRMNDCDWWADFSKEEAIKNYCKFAAIDLEEDEEIQELTEEEMNNLKFKPDPYDEPNVDMRTFKEELDRNIKEGKTEPFFFASTEF